MNIKTYMAIAVAALTAACNQAAPEAVEDAANNAIATVELNEDGSVNTETVVTDEAAK